MIIDSLVEVIFSFETKVGEKRKELHQNLVLSRSHLFAHSLFNVCYSLNILCWLWEMQTMKAEELRKEKMSRRRIRKEEWVFRLFFCCLSTTVSSSSYPISPSLSFNLLPDRALPGFRASKPAYRRF